MLVGAIGISGDGVDQERFDRCGRRKWFLPPTNMRADQIFVRGVRLPFLKFPGVLIYDPSLECGGPSNVRRTLFVVV